MTDFFQRVRDEVTVYDIFTQHLSDVPKGAQQFKTKIPCPFHGSDSDPSLMIYPHTNTAHCFGCGGTWDPISLYAQFNEYYKLDDSGSKVPDPKHSGWQLDYGKAARELARKYKIEYIVPDWFTNLKKVTASLNEKKEHKVSTDELETIRNIYLQKFRRESVKFSYGIYDMFSYALMEGEVCSITSSSDMHKWFDWAMGMLVFEQQRGQYITEVIADANS